MVALFCSLKHPIDQSGELANFSILLFFHRQIEILLDIIIFTSTKNSNLNIEQFKRIFGLFSIGVVLTYHGSKQHKLAVVNYCI